MTLWRDSGAVTASIAAQNTFTDWLVMRAREIASVSVSGSFAGTTVTLQRTFDGGTTPLDVATFTSAAEDAYEGDETCKIRLGVKTGNYSAGPAVCRLGKGTR